MHAKSTGELWIQGSLVGSLVSVNRSVIRYDTIIR